MKKRTKVKYRLGAVFVDTRTKFKYTLTKLTDGKCTAWYYFTCNITKDVRSVGPDELAFLVSKRMWKRMNPLRGDRRTRYLRRLFKRLVIVTFDNNAVLKYAQTTMTTYHRSQDGEVESSALAHDLRALVKEGLIERVYDEPTHNPTFSLTRGHACRGTEE